MKTSGERKASDEKEEKEEKKAEFNILYFATHLSSNSCVVIVSRFLLKTLINEERRKGF